MEAPPESEGHHAAVVPQDQVPELARGQRRRELEEQLELEAEVQRHLGQAARSSHLPFPVRPSSQRIVCRCAYR